MGLVTSSVHPSSILCILNSRLDELLELLVLDIGGRPFRYLISRQIATELHFQRGN